MSKIRQSPRRLGQVFLHDQNIVNKICRFAQIEPKDNVIEIGCGRGILTKALLDIVESLHVIEIDKACILATQKELPNATIHFHHEDVLNMDFSKLPSPQHIVANIPYNITTPIIEKLIQYKSHLKKAVIMVQKEVAERITSAPCNKSYGSLSLFCQFHFETSIGFQIPRSCFYPEPNVDSAILCLVPKPKPFDVNETTLFSVIRAAFWGRRKTLLNCLTKSPHTNYQNSIKNIPEIEPFLLKRGETLSLADFATLVHYLEKHAS